MANETEHSNLQVEASQARRPRFWVGPLLVGCCFSLGYGITHRVVTLQANPKPPSPPEPFVRQQFPGQSLASLRRSTGGSGSLVVDVAAIEAKEEAERQAKAKAEEQARRQVELARKKELALQPPPEPLWLQEPQPVPSALIEPLVDPSLDPFNPRDPLLEATAPEATVDQSDFFVPVEPNPAPAP